MAKDNKDLIEQLADLQGKLDSRKLELKKCEWERDTLMKRLKEEFGLDSREQGNVRLGELEARIVKMEASLKKTLDAARKEMEGGRCLA